MNYFKLQIYVLVLLMALGSCSGAYITANDHNSIGSGTKNGKTIYVANNGTDRNTGLTPETPKRNIANAIRSANPNDIIKVSPGTYRENFVIDKNITIIGNNQKNTIQDGNQTNICIIIKPEVEVQIINLTIKNGKDPGNKYFGGGIQNHGTLTLINTTITNNTSDYGGGICSYGPMTIKKTTITNNKVDVSGGGISTDHTLVMEDSTITNNTATTMSGGGIDSISPLTLRRVIISNNSAGKNGGGILCANTLIIEDSIITGNVAAILGGGIQSVDLTYVYGCVITNNRANDGGGINIRGTAYIDDPTQIANNTPNNLAGNPFIPA
jgi:predicted outer membrane repeat protein